jgi:tetratricopeptide (TPR) repeat protein
MERRKPLRVFALILALGCLGGVLSAMAAKAQTLSAVTLQDPLGCDGASARAVAMGQAFVAVSDDSSALFFNPAGLGNLRGTEVGVHHLSGLSGITQEVLSLGWPVRKRFGFGYLGQYVNYGRFQGREADGTSTTSLNAYQAGLGLGCGVNLAKGLYAGAAFRGTLQRFASSSYRLFNGDIGLLYVAPHGWRLGASYLNLGTAVQGSRAASVAHIGAAKKFGGKGPYTLLVATAFSYESSYGAGAQVGLEGSFQSGVLLRAGYSYDAQKVGFEGLRGLTAGAGLVLKGFKLDYAFLPFGDLGTTHRVSLGYRFGDVRPNARPLAVGTTVPIIGAPSTQVSPAGESFMVQPEPVADESVIFQDSSLSIAFDLPSSDVVEGQKLEGLGRWVEAVNAYKRAVGIDPRNARAWWQLANLYMRFDRKDEAVRCFEAVVQLKPEAKSLAEWLEKYKSP